jgi:hypothetical protein
MSSIVTFPQSEFTWSRRGRDQGGMLFRDPGGVNLEGLKNFREKMLILVLQHESNMERWGNPPHHIVLIIFDVARWVFPPHRVVLIVFDAAR